MLTQARYMPYDLRPVCARGSGPSVVLLHGLYASAGVFRPLRELLRERLDASTYTLSYVPGPGILELSERVAAVVRGIEDPQGIHLVGHSLGGLVMRHYASSDALDTRVVSTVSLAAPFLGSKKSFLVPGQAGRDIAPGAVILARLGRNIPENLRVPHLTLVGGEDSLIVPGAYPSFGEQALIRGAGHNGILFHEEAMERVVSKVARLSGVRAP